MMVVVAVWTQMAKNPSVLLMKDLAVGIHIQYLSDNMNCNAHINLSK